MYVLAIDQGTTGTTACLIDSQNYNFVAKSTCEFSQIFPQPAMVEHDLNEIWESVKKSIEDVFTDSEIDKKDICAIGITNQRETTCVFDKEGSPLHNAIVWQDRRTEDFCKELRAQAGTEDFIKNKTGLPIDPYFSATKIAWLEKHLSSKKDVMYGTIDTFLLYKLTAGNAYKTEVTNASRTMLMDIKSCCWDDQLLDLFKISKESLPQICDSFGIFGSTANLDFLPDNIPISAILGDQQAALFGQGGVESGDMKCTYGTGAFMLLNTGQTLKSSKEGLLSTVAYKFKDDLCYALEGSCYIAGAAVQWLRDNCQFFKRSDQIEEFARRVELHEMKYLLFLPFFTGAGSPYWNSDVQASIVGITRDTGIEQLSLACLDGIALSINDLKNAFAKDMGRKIDSFWADGGASSNDLLMELQATISDVDIFRPKIIETTAYGIGLASLVGKNKLKLSQIKSLIQEDKHFKIDNLKKKHYDNKKDQWNKYVVKNIANL